MRHSIIAAVIAIGLPLVLAGCASQKRVATLETRVRVLEAEHARQEETAARVAALELQLRAAGSMTDQLARLAQTLEDTRLLSESALEAAVEAEKQASATAAQVAAAPGAGAAAQPARPRPPAPDPAVTYAVPLHDSPVVGPKDALVTIVMGAEFACPYCEKVRATLDDVRKRYPKEVRIVHKHFIVHPQVATDAAHAACAAHKQGRYDDMAAALWDKAFQTRQFDEQHILDLARNAGFEMVQFAADMKGAACANEVQRDVAALTQLGVRGTPAFFINGRFLSGAQPLQSFETLIDEELKKAEKAVRGGIKRKKYYDHLIKTGKTSV